MQNTSGKLKRVENQMQIIVKTEAEPKQVAGSRFTETIMNARNRWYYSVSKEDYHFLPSFLMIRSFYVFIFFWWLEPFKSTNAYWLQTISRIIPSEAGSFNLATMPLFQAKITFYLLYARH